MDVAEYGVKVSSVFPGLMNTDLGNRPGPNPVNPEDMFQSEEIAKIVEWVIFDTSDTCNINEVFVDARHVERAYTPESKHMWNNFMNRFYPNSSPMEANSSSK